MGWECRQEVEGVLPDGFYFHCEVGVKLSAEGEKETGGRRLRQGTKERGGTDK